ncbi:UDP-N-acetyl-D-mannosamine dehydrogenase [Nostoc ellipsosporum NOK]|uniref:UDP-N-acetyl-D-mannosamine dehydrogenase n=1 Tax=Sphingomonas sp. IBVSS2 TaxID=1985172 RepID=UPI000A2D9779|nr:UDP-N-acetyl-D-mannosamine dehydrogenase [Sphingomonas sp. IBVSS2]MDF2384377.1 UDP-N-acetyl-D-mannosamine dehydrogenase [Nostoc ellipsosporum NOK]OSZ68491.1 UDP-N-acetyl-D-mannosamine dehydrogenase [Sphingomonas sp. IBVSS2]
MSFETICVVGLGYIGLPTAAIIASRRRKVIGLDVNAAVVESINRGETHIVEPDLDAVVRTAVLDGYLRATTEAEPADVFVVAVPTPFRDGHVPDLSYIEAASRTIAPALRAGNLVILESTSPVGATEAMAGWLAAARPDLTFPETHGGDSDIRVAHCPERVLPGNVLRELVQNDRVIGGLSKRCSEQAVALYRIFVEGECMITDARTAEMCKLTENSFRDANIAFANELSLICDKIDVDVWELIRLANRHPRVNILQPGPGVGGHCIAVDPWFIVHSSPDAARLIRTAREVNDGKPHWVVDKVRALVAAQPGRAKVACMGLAFKPNIDDLRESPALDICLALASAGDCDVLAVEPHVEALPARLEGRAMLVSAAQAVSEADIVVFLVNHSAFRELPGNAFAGKALFDACGFLRNSA